MKKISIMVSLTAVLALVGCSTIRIQYEGEVHPADGKPSKFVFEKSYPVPLHPTLCALTGIFFGGDCWFYVVMPTIQQQQAVTADAQKALAKKMKSAGVKTTKESVNRISWEDKPESSTLTEIDAD